MDNAVFNDLVEMEAYAEMMMEKAAHIIRYCRNAKKKLAGVSTPALNTGSDAKLKAEVLAKRRARLTRQKKLS